MNFFKTRTGHQYHHDNTKTETLLIERSEDWGSVDPDKSWLSWYNGPEKSGGNRGKIATKVKHVCLELKAVATQHCERICRERDFPNCQSTLGQNTFRNNADIPAFSIQPPRIPRASFQCWHPVPQSCPWQDTPSVVYSLHHS